MSELGQPYEMHRTLMRAFPKATDAIRAKARKEFSVLFRADEDDRQGVVKVLVQSLVEPNWAFLEELHDYLFPISGVPAHDCKDVMPAYREIQDGQILRFRLRANPTKRVAKKDDPMRGKRVELSREEDQIDWLDRKGRGRMNEFSGGFELLSSKSAAATAEDRRFPNVHVISEGKLRGRKFVGPRRHATKHFSVLFEGVLRVTDTAAFLHTLVEGIGTGKAYGFGLLSLAPVNSSGTEQA